MLVGKYHNHMRASQNTNKRVIGLCVAHLRMAVYNVMDKHYRSQYSNLFLKRLSFGSKECAEELKLECASFLGQTS